MIWWKCLKDPVSTYKPHQWSTYKPHPVSTSRPHPVLTSCLPNRSAYKPHQWSSSQPNSWPANQPNSRFLHQCASLCRLFPHSQYHSLNVIQRRVQHKSSYGDKYRLYTQVLTRSRCASNYIVRPNTAMQSCQSAYRLS